MEYDRKIRRRSDSMVFLFDQPARRPKTFFRKGYPADHEEIYSYALELFCVLRNIQSGKSQNQKSKIAEQQYFR